MTHIHARWGDPTRKGKSVQVACVNVSLSQKPQDSADFLFLFFTNNYNCLFILCQADIRSLCFLGQAKVSPIDTGIYNEPYEVMCCFVYVSVFSYLSRL